MRRVTSSWQVIENVLQENAHSAYQALRPPVTDHKIRQFEKLLGQKLPPDFVTSLRVHDGMRGTAELINYLSLLPVSRSRSWWQVQCRVQEMGEFGGNRYTRTRKIKNDARWRPGWVPVMADAGGNLLVLDLDPGPAGRRGQLFPWYNNGEGVMRVIAESFTAWLDALAEELIHRRFTLDEFGGIQLRKRLV